MQEISTCILVITLASLMAFDTDGIGRTYLQLKNADNSFSLNCKYFFLLELSGGESELNMDLCALLKEAIIFKACYKFCF